MAHILLHCGLTMLLPTTNQAKSRIECQYKSSIGKQNQEFTNGNNYPSIKISKWCKTTKICSLFPPSFVNPVTKYNQVEKEYFTTQIRSLWTMSIFPLYLLILEYQKLKFTTRISFHTISALFLPILITTFHVHKIYESQILGYGSC